MKQIFKKIWKAALPYNDFRDDKGHAEIVTKYATELLKKSDADPDVVIPSAIMHDIGWSQLTTEEIFVIFDKEQRKLREPEVRKKHQDEGVKIARKILNDLNYDQEKTKHVLEIISEHDTREGFYSREDGIMRDADKLWRYSKTGFWADVKRGFAASRTKRESKKLIHATELLQRRNFEIDKKNFFYSEEAKKIARFELKQRKSEIKS